MSRIVLIDGDILAYRCGFACEHKKYYATIDGEQMLFEGKQALNDYIKEHEPEEYEWESELFVEPLNYALSTVKRMVKNIVKETKADEFELYLSDQENYRDRIATIAKYKGNRDHMRRPLHYEDIHRYMKDNLDAVIVENMEADDMLATRQLVHLKNGDDPVIASIDKDLLQIPGKHYNFQTEKKLQVSEETARKNRYIQLLTGDRTDNIPGIYGCGPAKAAKILQDVAPEAYREAVEKAWHDYFVSLSEPEARRPDWFSHYDAERQRVVYMDYQGDWIHEKDLSKFVDEIDALVTVGVPDGERKAVRRNPVPDGPPDTSDQVLAGRGA